MFYMPSIGFAQKLNVMLILILLILKSCPLWPVRIIYLTKIHSIYKMNDLLCKAPSIDGFASDVYEDVATLQQERVTAIEMSSFKTG